VVLAVVRVGLASAWARGARSRVLVVPLGTLGLASERSIRGSAARWVGAEACGRQGQGGDPRCVRALMI
jgi:hypothetical protein